MKQIFYCIIFLLQLSIAHSQLPNGSIAPNFVATDINGDEWELYDLLNEGKKVILDISATWCGPCWDYHAAGELENLYEEFGPDGTDEFFVFLIEGDESTNIDDLYGNGESTLGNWVEGTKYPIIDSREIAEAYKINFYPTLFLICPSRETYQINQLTAAEIYNDSDVCLQASGLNNASILDYGGLEGSFCENLDFAPSIFMQNMGTNAISAATVNLTIDDVLIETIDWTGNLNTYNVNEIVFDSVFLTGGNELIIDIENVNGGLDEDLDNNIYVANLDVSPFAQEEVLEFEINLDNSPASIYWEIEDANGNILYNDGDKSIAYANASNEERYLTPLSTHLYEIALPIEACYEFRIFDNFGDGICCSNGSGNYKLTKENGEVLFEGAEFDFEKTHPFGLSDNPGVSNNASIIDMTPLPPDFCHSLIFSPQVKIQNLGGNEISELEVEISGNSESYLTHRFSTSILPGKIKTIDLPEISVSDSDDITVTIQKVNDELDIYEYRNSTSSSAFRRTTTPQNWTIDLYTGTNAHEIYWQLTDEDNEVLISGGNEVVGSSGGGQGIATINDQGAYDDNQPIIENITLPGPGCYQLMVFDDAGNGFSGGGFGVPSPYFRIRNNSVGIIVDTDGNFPDSFHANIEIVDPNSNNVLNKQLQDLILSPNPVADVLTVSIDNIENSTYHLSISSAVTGQQIISKELTVSGGNIFHQVPIRDFPPGVFNVKIQNKKTFISKRFVVSR